MKYNKIGRRFYEMFYYITKKFKDSTEEGFRFVSLEHVATT